MVSSRKRGLREVEPDVDAPAPPKEASLVQRIRDTWQFANLFQWIFLFGKVVKIDESIDIDDLETECLKPRSTVLVDIGLSLLKFVSSHRGLTPDLFDEYTRRQYVAKAPERNPFGTGPEPNKFHDFDIFTKLRVLHQLTIWVMLHPERIREKMEEQKLSDQTEWRIEPCGWDSDDRTYYILDDNRVYRMTEAAPEQPSAWKPKKNTQKAKAAARAAKRRRVSRSAAHEDDAGDDEAASGAAASSEPQDDGLGGAKWECVATTLQDVQYLLGTFRKTRDENERNLKSTIEEHLLPIFERQEASRQRKALQREKELLSLEKMAHAKRSSRIANRDEQRRAEDQTREEEQKRRVEEAAAKKEEVRLRKLEKERDNRMMSREQRLREREVRRQQHEEELAQLSEDSKNVDDGGNGRLSERRRQAKIEKSRQALKDLEDEEEDWIFDCVCGVYGQIDDGSHSVACERCNVWQHSSCVGISEEEADLDDFHFICKSCRQPKTPIIKLKTKKPEILSAQDTSAAEASTDTAPPPQTSELRVEIPAKSLGKPHLSPQNGGTSEPALPSIAQPQATGSSTGPQSIPIKSAGQNSTLPPSPLPHTESNPFSSPHPNLLPPDQSPNKSRAYSTLYAESSDQARRQTGSTSPKINGRSPAPSSISLPPAPTHSEVTGAESPSKKHLATPSASFSSTAQTPGGPGSSSPVGLTTPRLKHNGAETGLDGGTPTLPPTQNGISPLKRSSPPAHPSSQGNPTSTPAQSIIPPIAALSPSPSQPILTPPVKPTEPTRPTSQQSNGATKSG